LLDLARSSSGLTFAGPRALILRCGRQLSRTEGQKADCDIMMQPTSWSAGWARMALAVQRGVGSMRSVISANVSVPFLLPKTPAKPRGHALVAREEAKAGGDGTVGRAETEEERRARRHRIRAVRERLRKVHLVRRLGAVQRMREPGKVRMGDEGKHSAVAHVSDFAA